MLVCIFKSILERERCMLFQQVSGVVRAASREKLFAQSIATRLCEASTFKRLRLKIRNVQCLLKNFYWLVYKTICVFFFNSQIDSWKCSEIKTRSLFNILTARLQQLDVSWVVPAERKVKSLLMAASLPKYQIKSTESARSSVNSHPSRGDHAGETIQ